MLQSVIMERALHDALWPQRMTPKLRGRLNPGSVEFLLIPGDEKGAQWTPNWKALRAPAALKPRPGPGESGILAIEVR